MYNLALLVWANVKSGQSDSEETREDFKNTYCCENI